MNCLIRGAVLAWAASAALLSLPETAVCQDTRTIRSVNDPRHGFAGARQQPLWRERESHRGWEVRESQYTVFATTNLDDARWAAGQVRQAWADAERLADRWTDLHRQPGFGLGATQIVIDSEPPRERDGPPATVNVVGIQTQIYLNVAPGQPTLREQMLRLREAAAFAMLHTAGLDSAVPPWVMQGLAANVAAEGLSSEEQAAAQEVKIPGRLAGQQWRYTRSSPDVLDYPPLDESAAAAQINFLLEGDDARHAPALLAEIRAAWNAAEQGAIQGDQFRVQQGEARPASGHSRFDRLMSDLRSQFEDWQKDPPAGQPILETDPSLAPDVLAAQREMLVLLKLQRKLAPPATDGPRPRVTTFDREQGRQVVMRQSTPAAPASVDELARRLSDQGAQPIATRDVDGSLLLSSDARRIDELLHPPGEVCTLAFRGQQQVLVRQLADGTLLQGWLEENSENPARPLAKFELAHSRPAARSSTLPAAKSARGVRMQQWPLERR